MVSFIGAILIVMGLYSVLWGKYKEYKEKEAEEEIPKVIKGTNNTNNQMVTIFEEIESDDIESRKIEVNGAPIMAIVAPTPQPPMIAIEAPK